MSQAGSIRQETTIPVTVPEDFVTDAGTAVSALNIINVLGSGSVNTTGAGNTVTINSPVASYTTQSGTATALNGVISIMGAGTATTSGSGNSIVITTSGSGGGGTTTYNADSGIAVEVANTINVLGSGGIQTSAAGNTVTVNSPSGRYAFISNLSGDVSNVTGDGTAYSVICDNVQYQVGSGYNNATGIFTAPVTGLYSLSFTCSLGNVNAGHTTGRYFITLTGISYEFCQCSPASLKNADSNTAMTGTGFFRMTAGDTAVPQVVVNGGTKTITVHGSAPVSSPYCIFSGALIG